MSCPEKCGKLSHINHSYKFFNDLAFRVNLGCQWLLLIAIQNNELKSKLPCPKTYNFGLQRAFPACRDHQLS